MPFAFQKMQLEADSLLALVSTWAEMQLIVEETSATIIGYGYTDEIAEAFTILVFDWEATIILDRSQLEIPIGSYDLIRSDDQLFACKDQQSFILMDQPVKVAVLSVPED